jgi:uncharacterized protein (TIGR03067 family)
MRAGTRVCAGLIGTLALLLATSSGRAGDDKADLEKFQGTWKVVLFERNGNTIPAERVAGRILIVRGEKFTDKQGDRVLGEGTMKLDSSKSPKVIDAKFTAGPEDILGQNVPAIYRFDGEKLEVVSAPPDKPRPSKFASEADTGQMHIIYERMK